MEAQIYYNIYYALCPISTYYSFSNTFVTPSLLNLSSQGHILINVLCVYIRMLNIMCITNIYLYI